MKNSWLAILLCCASLIILSACQSKLEPIRQIEEFSFTDQHGNAFGTKQLHGRVWIANFIFTNCETVCPPMTSELSNLQKAAAEQNLPIDIVSFTVDPVYDTPEKLGEYLQSFAEDDSNWHMLSGYSQKEIEQFALKQFQTIVQKPKNSTQVLHGTNYYIVDQHGQLVGEYGFSDNELQDKLFSDIKRLLR